MPRKATTPVSANSTIVPSVRMRPLQRLVGTWVTSGVILKRGEPTEDSFTFVDQYAWLPGGHFIAHTVTGALGDTPLQGLEVIGYDGAVLRATSYDSLGVVTKYRVRLHGRTWSMIGEKDRFSGIFAVDGQRLEGKWERRMRGGVWQAIMRVTLTRIGV